MSPTLSHITKAFSSIRDDSQRISEDPGSLSEPHLQNSCSQAATLLITLSERMPAEILSHCICYSLTTHSEEDEHLFVYHSQILSSSSSWRHIPHQLHFLWSNFFPLSTPRDICIPKQQEMQPPDLSLYTHITTLSFRLIKLSIQVDHCSEVHCLLGISLQLCLPESQVQKSSLTPAIAHTSAPWKRSLLGGKLRRILCSDMGDERSWFLCTHAVAMPQFANQASERSLNISILK